MTLPLSITAWQGRWVPRLVHGAVGVGVVTGFAGLLRYGHGWAGIVAWCLCVGIPVVSAWSCGDEGWWRRACRWEGRLAGAAIAAAVLIGLVPMLAIWGVVEGLMGAVMLHPGLREGAWWLLGQLPPVVLLAGAEEWFFRGWLQGVVLGRGRGAVIAGAVLFALAHVGAWGVWLWLPGWFAAGWILGTLVDRSGGALLPAVILHAAANLAVAWFRVLLVMNNPMF